MPTTPKRSRATNPQGNYFRTQYGPQTIEAGFITVRQMLVYAAVTGGAPLAIGAYLAMLRGEIALLLLGAERSSFCFTPGHSNTSGWANPPY
jgi:hypothetical protein